jgi:hypothetical protein
MAIMKGDRSTPRTLEAWGNILARRLVDVPAEWEREGRGEERRAEESRAEERRAEESGKYHGWVKGRNRVRQDEGEGI